MELAKPKNIFIVDDDVLLTAELKEYLTRNVAHTIQIFYTGEECLKHVAQEPDVIILAYYLNTVDKNAANGMEILETIKKSYPAIHIIMFSSQEHYGIAMQSIQKGAEQYVIKDEEAFEKIALMISEMP
jgi:two-component system, OmpR family, response regulator